VNTSASTSANDYPLINPFKIGIAYLHALMEATKSADLFLKIAISCFLFLLNFAKFLIKSFNDFSNLPINLINPLLAGYNLVFNLAISALYNL